VHALPGRTPTPRIQWPSLALAMSLMIAGTLYPPLMTDRAGHADHALAGLLAWAMSAGFVRGVGFVPRHAIVRPLLSGWACVLAGTAFVLLKMTR